MAWIKYTGRTQLPGIPDDALHSAERALLWALQSRRQHGQCARCHAYSNNLLCVRCGGTGGDVEIVT